MYILRILLNVLILALEIGAIAGAAWLGLNHPVYFAILTAALCLLMGLVLEPLRLSYELQFYFGPSRRAMSWAARGFAFFEALFKGLLAGIVALIAFSGTDTDRLFYVAVIFGVCIFAGSSMLRRLSMSLGANQSRWGYFRLAAPLGLLFSAAVSFLPKPSLATLGWTAVFDLPERPTLEQASEFLFGMKQQFDEMVVRLLSLVMPPDFAKIIGILVSVNMLTGFVIAVYAVAIAEMVRRMEERSP
ncbi:MAG: hypothetical protein RLZ98_2978 [Pseudomonadota bacterium]|jgi:hypothetical protein